MWTVLRFLPTNAAEFIFDESGFAALFIRTPRQGRDDRGLSDLPVKSSLFEALDELVRLFIITIYGHLVYI